MGSLQERKVAYANLVDQLKELYELREQVKEAERLSAASKLPKQRPANFHRRAPTRRIH
jgi:hypothetical protein